MTSAPARVALLGAEGDARAHLRQVILDYGAQISIEADPRAVEPAALSATGSTIIVVSLDDSIEAALDAFQPVFDEPGVSVIFDEAAVTRKLGGWELARWARHLASKLSGDAATTLPAAPADARRLPSFDMRPQPGAPLRPDQQMHDATLSQYTGDTPDLARQVPSLEVPGGGARVAYAPAYVREAERTAEDALQLDDDEIMRALTGDGDSTADAPADAPAAAPRERDSTAWSEEIDLAAFLETAADDAAMATDIDPIAAPAPASDDGEPVAIELDDSYLDADFSFVIETSPADIANAPASRFSEFGETDHDAIALDPELLALAAELDANSADDELAQSVVEPDFARRSPVDEDDDRQPFAGSDAPAAALAAAHDAKQSRNKSSAFENLELVVDDEDSADGMAMHRQESVVPAEIDFDALIAGLSLADDDASTVATRHGAVVIFSGAGGPDAVRQVLASLPGDLPVPVVLMQHLEGANHDRLVPQLAKVSALPVVLAEAGKSVDAGRVFVMPDALSLTMGRHGNLSFVADVQPAEAQLAALASLGRDLLVALASGAPASLADALPGCVAAGATVIAQDPARCFDATACASAKAAGGQVGAMAELTARAVERWQQ